MSCSKWAYKPEMCDGHYCPGDCDLCDLPDKYDDETEEEYEAEMEEERRGYK